LKQDRHVRSKNRTCPVKVTGTQLLTQISPVRLRIRRSPDMSELGAGHVRQKPLEFGQKPGYVRFFENFGLEIDFDDLHFTNSPDASLMILWSS
jgi:hypothetical protein